MAELHKEILTGNKNIDVIAVHVRPIHIFEVILDTGNAPSCK